MDLDVNNVESIIFDGAIQVIKESGLMQIPSYFTNVYGPEYQEVITRKFKIEGYKMNLKGPKGSDALVHKIDFHGSIKQNEITRKPKSVDISEVYKKWRKKRGFVLQKAQNLYGIRWCNRIREPEKLNIK